MTSLERRFAASLAAKPHNKVRMLWQHNRDEPIGVWTKFEEDDFGLKAEGKLILETARGREAYALLKAGALDSLSIGYNTIRATRDHTKSARILEEVLQRSEPCDEPNAPGRNRLQREIKQRHDRCHPCSYAST